MAAGFDELIDFLLAEVALCGTQGTWGLRSNPSLIANSGTTFISIIFASYCCNTLMAKCCILSACHIVVL